MSKRQGYATSLVRLRRQGRRLREQVGLYNAPGAHVVSPEARTTLSVIHEVSQLEDDSELHGATGTPPPPAILALCNHPLSRQVVIPQALYSRAGGLAHMRDEPSASWQEYAARVPFALQDPIPGIHGVPLAFLLNGRGDAFAPYVREAHVPVLNELASRGVSVIQLEVRWPAYPSFVYRRKVQIADAETGQPFTRLRVGCILADMLKLFTMEARCERVSVDPWEAEYRFGPGGLVFEGLWLVSLWHVGWNVFEAEMRYTQPLCN